MVHALARHPQIELSVCAPPGDLPSTVRYTPDPSEARWLAELVDGGGISHALRQPRLSAIAAPAQLLRILARNYRYSDADIYHVNWLQTALPLPADRRPALITVLGNDLKLLQLPGMKALIRRKIATRRAILCPNADWMVRPLENVFGDLSDVRAIPFGIDPLWYGIKRRTFDSAAARWLTVARITRANWARFLTGLSISLRIPAASSTYLGPEKNRCPFQAGFIITGRHHRMILLTDGSRSPRG